MHELHATQNLCDAAAAAAANQGAARVTAVYIQNGVLSTMEEGSVRLYWEMVSKGTICEGAQLNIETVDAEANCQACGRIFTPPHRIATCPECGSVHVQLRKGAEFLLKSLDIEKVE